MRKLEIGLGSQISHIVEEKHLAVTVGSGQARVFATPMLLAGMEAAAMAAIADCLEPGQTTVGIHADVRHIAATPPGIKVTCEATLTQVSGKKLTFAVKANDEAGMIGEGTHERAIVDLAKFEQKAGNKMVK